MKIQLLIAFITLLFHIISSYRLRHKKGPSNFADDDLAYEDQFDPTIKKKVPYIDYNNESGVNENDVLKDIKEDLRFENVSYKYD